MTAWPTLPTFTGASIPDADDLNAIRDALLYLYEHREPIGSISEWSDDVIPDGYLELNGQAVSRTTYADLFALYVRISTVTITIASPGVVTWTAHGLAEGAPIKFATTGGLPSGIVAGTQYYVKSPTANSFNLAATPGGSAINTSGSQSGTHTATVAPYGLGNGTTTFNVPDFRGRSPIGANDTTYFLGHTGGAESVTLSTANLPAHNHTSPVHSHGVGYLALLLAAGANSVPAINTTGSGGFSVATDSSGSGDTGNGPGSSAGVNVRNPFLAAIFLVRAL